MNKLNIVNKFLIANLLLLGSIIYPSIIQAEITADQNAPANKRPEVLNAANGVPLVNIQTPSAAGVSLNSYSQLDVQKQGAILNNSRTNVQTQLAGWVQSNPKLAGGSANVIVNQVNSNNPSLLQGFIEVAGVRAQVIIANPSGITCDGCGFINASRATVTTGVPIITNGNLDGYRVHGGMINITGKGLNSNDADYTDLIARSVKINAGVWAKHLAITTGINQVNATNTSAQPISEVDDKDRPLFAVDTAALGGMYAGKIFLIGTEAGVGVRNAGKIGATAGEVVVTVEGKLENSGQINAAHGAIHLAALGINNNDGDISGSSIVANSREKTFDNKHGKIISTSTNDDGTLNIKSGELNNEAGLIQANGFIKIDTNGKYLINKNSGKDGGIVSLSGINLITGNLNNQAGRIISQGALGFRGEEFNNEAGLIQAEGFLKIDTSGKRFINRNSKNSGGIIGKSNITLISGDLDNRSGYIGSEGILDLKYAELNNKNGAIQAQGILNIDGDSHSSDSDGLIFSKGDLKIKLKKDHINTAEFKSDREVFFETAGTFINKAQMFAKKFLHIKAASIDNQFGSTIKADQLKLEATSDHTLTNRGIIDGIDTIIETPTIENLGTGKIYGDHIAIGATTLTNATENGVAPIIAARNRLDIGATTINNSEHARILSYGDLAIGGALDANKQATGQADTLNNSSATIEAKNNIYFNVKNINNINAHFSTTQKEISKTKFDETKDNIIYSYWRTITETEVQESKPAEIIAGGSINIIADKLHNDKSRIVAGNGITNTINGVTSIIKEIIDTETKGKRITTDSGTATSFWFEEHCRFLWVLNCHNERKDGSPVPYNSDSTTEFDLNPEIYKNSTPLQSTGTQIPDFSPIIQNDAGFKTLLNVNTAIPDNSLFTVNQNPTSHYLIETDPNFANFRQWLSSDYLLNAMSYDPATVQKRLGDGFYEQKLINEQVMQLTGRRFTNNYKDDEIQYQALMDNGVNFAKAHQLVPGISLSSELMAQLTSDIVWLEEKETTLPNGQTTKVLIPKLYLRAQNSDTQTFGSLISADNINLNVQELTNSGTISGKNFFSLTAENMHNLAGKIFGNDINIQASNDINNIGGKIQATNSITLAAARNLNVISETISNSSLQGSRTNLSNIAEISLIGHSGDILLTAGDDANFTAASILNSSPTSKTTITAGNNLNFNTLTESASNNIVWDANNWYRDSSRTDVGTTIQTQGDIILQAGNDLNAKATTVTSDNGAISATAGHNINITAGESNKTVDSAYHHKEESAFSSKTITSKNYLNETLAQGSNFSAAATTLLANNDINIKGSNVVSTNDTLLSAQNNINIEAAKNSIIENHFSQEKKSGIFGDGSGFTVGTQKKSSRDNNISSYASASTIGSIQGNINIQAGKNYTQIGSNITAPKNNIDITAQRVDIKEARETSLNQNEARFKQSGVTVSVTNPLIEALKTSDQMRRAFKETKDNRMKTLASATIAFAGKNAYDALKSDPTKLGGINLGVSFGSSQSKSNSQATSDQALGSTVTAGNNINIRATGAGTASDLTIQGSNIKAANDTFLKADNKINLLAAGNRNTQNSSSKSSSMSLGGSIGTDGLLGTGSVSRGRGKSNGEDITWSNTHIDSGNKISLESGNDTTLKGAVANAKQVTATVGGNLKLESLQDKSIYDSKEQNVGVTASAGYGKGGGSINLGQNKMHSNFASITEQTAIHTQDQGFQINVTGATDLKGAVITSSDQAVKNNQNIFKTKSLTQSDIENKAEYKASSINVGFGYNTPKNSGVVGKNQKGEATTGSKKIPGSNLPSIKGFSATAPQVATASDDATSQTKSGISGIGNINADVRSEKDTTTNKLNPIFNKQEIETRFKIVKGLTKETSTFIENRAREIDAKKAQAKELEQQANDPNKNLSDTEKKELYNQAKNLRAESEKINKDWGAKGTYRQILTAMTAAAGGNVSSATGDFVKNAAVNYAQQQAAGYIGDKVKEGKLTEGSPLHAALHGAIGAAGGALTGQTAQSALSGAAGAAASSALAGAFEKINPKTSDETQSEKEAKRDIILNLIAGGAGAAGADAATATSAATASVDNNWLATKQKAQREKELSEAKSPEERRAVEKRWEAIDKGQDRETLQGIIDSIKEAGLSHEEKEQAVLEARDAFNNPDPEVTRQFNKKYAGAVFDRTKKTLEDGGYKNARQLGKDIGDYVGAPVAKIIIAVTAIKELFGVKAGASATKQIPKTAAKVTEGLVKGVDRESSVTTRAFEKAKEVSGKDIDELANKIAKGHAYEKHLKEFPEIKTKEELAAHVKKVMNEPTAVKELENGRKAYWREESKTVVIHDPKHLDQGTVFKPDKGVNYFNKKLK